MKYCSFTGQLSSEHVELMNDLKAENFKLKKEIHELRLEFTSLNMSLFKNDPEKFKSTCIERLCVPLEQ